MSPGFHAPAWERFLALPCAPCVPGQAISVNFDTAHAGWIKASHFGGSGLRCKRASMSFIAALDSEIPLSST